MTSLTPSRPRGLQRPQKRRPEALVRAITNVEAQDFTAPVGGNTDPHDDGLGYDPVPDPGLEAFERGGPDERGRLRIDQFLIESFGRDADRWVDEFLDDTAPGPPVAAQPSFWDPS